MDFSLEELKTLLEEMGFRNVPDTHLESFAKDLSRLMRHEKRGQKRNQKISSAPADPVPARAIAESSSSSQHSVNSGSNSRYLPSRDQPSHSKSRESVQSATHVEVSQRQKHDLLPPKPPARRVKSSEATRTRLKTDPVRLYHWYKTNWEHHGLQ